MVNPALLEQVARLSLDDRREFVAAVQDTIEIEEHPLTPARAAFMERRAAEAKANPFDGGPWEEFREELRERYGH